MQHKFQQLSENNKITIKILLILVNINYDQNMHKFFTYSN